MRQVSEQKANPAQETAIRHGAGPCAVIAGPGSGKTFVLVERIRYLIEELGVNPSSILVLTFSRAAAAHMRRRFLHSCARMETAFGTFHSVFFRILQESCGGKLRLIDPKAKQDYLRHLCDLHPDFLPEKVTAEELQLLISRSKNGLACSQKWIPELVRTYDNYLEGRGWLDFDDMILRCGRLLREKPEVLALWRSRFQWILVDEFQDVSPSQYEVLMLLAAPADNLFVVGDDDQSIYGFRGADPLMMKRFLTDYIQEKEDADSRRVFLTTNYRCGAAILEAGTALIRSNTNRIDKDFRTGSALKGAFACRPFSDRTSQYGFIARQLEVMTPEERKQTAVIFRTHAAAAHFIRLLKEYDMPLPADPGGAKQLPVTDRALILQDLSAYYRAAAGVSGSSSAGVSRNDLLRIMNRPERFLSGSFIPFDHMDRDQLVKHAGYEQKAVSEMLRDLELFYTLPPMYSMRYLLDSVGYRTYALAAYNNPCEILDELYRETCGQDSVQQWMSVLEELSKETAETTDSAKSADSADSAAPKAGKMDTGDGVQKALKMPKAGQIQQYGRMPISGQIQQSGRMPISGQIQQYGRMSISGQIQQSGRKPKTGQVKLTGDKSVKSAASDPAVHVLTMHACKGLEFDTVFIPDLNEGSIPSKRSWTFDEVEEERRLLYVAMTRARRSLTLTYLEGTPDRPATPSRFLQPFVKRSGS